MPMGLYPDISSAKQKNRGPNKLIVLMKWFIGFLALPRRV
jgi:hypothetical protein